ncbi:Serine/threonine protein phosphatase [hydrothermal vent metagenome]|uniref:Serine/threonine protein phosphatase n=1 Tax=hydrothermal vent metagenome TaxID=652676 RepID=A0A3B0U076_9ZZZZ
MAFVIMNEKAAWRPHVPPGQRIYAVGDIHGMSELLEDILSYVRADLAARPPAGKVTLVFLGDYVDRGPDSAKVLARLADLKIPDVDVRCLMGNHEELFQQFLDEPIDIWPHWLLLGAVETLGSFGVAAPRNRVDRAQILAARKALSAEISTTVAGFFGSLRLFHVAGDYLFVHAGLKSNVPLERQDARDLLWIRREFLDSAEPFSHFVIHGHTPTQSPDVAANRIGIDTGAYLTGVLSCLVLEADRRWVFQSNRPDLTPL